MNSIPWEDPERRICFDAWFAAQAGAHGLNASTLKLASADASFRCYLSAPSR